MDTEHGKLIHFVESLKLPYEKKQLLMNGTERLSEDECGVLNMVFDKFQEQILGLHEELDDIYRQQAYAENGG